MLSYIVSHPDNPPIPASCDGALAGVPRNYLTDVPLAMSKLTLSPFLAIDKNEMIF